MSELNTWFLQLADGSSTEVACHRLVIGDDSNRIPNGWVAAVVDPTDTRLLLFGDQLVYAKKLDR